MRDISGIEANLETINSCLMVLQVCRDAARLPKVYFLNTGVK